MIITGTGTELEREREREQEELIRRILTIRKRGFIDGNNN